MSKSSKKADTPENVANNDEDHIGRQWESNRPAIYRHKKSRDLYRTVGACINKDTDEYSILYRKWDDLGSADQSLYVREYKKFHEAFEKYDYKELSIEPTYEQATKDLMGPKKSK